MAAHERNSKLLADIESVLARVAPTSSKQKEALKREKQRFVEVVSFCDVLS